MWPGDHQIYKTEDNVIIYVSKGGKSPYNFKVKYQEPGKLKRTPKHIHIIIDLYLKREHEKSLTNELVDHIIDNIIMKVRPSSTNPPQLQVFSQEQLLKYENLNRYGEYSTEFLLVVTELIMIQEITNYPNGRMHLNLFRKFKNGADIFSVVSAATFR